LLRRLERALTALCRATAAPGSASERASAGFTLIETLAALAIAGAIFAVIAEFSGRLLLNWNRNDQTIAAMEMITRGLGRLGTDLTLALPMTPPGTDGSTAYFIGDPKHLMFVAATGFGVGDRGLELLDFAMNDNQDDFYLVRQRAPVSNPPAQLGDPVILLHGRMQVRFAYRDSAGNYSDTWAKRPDLPSAVAVQVIGASGPIFPRPILFPVPVNYSVDCLNTDLDARPPRCGGQAQAAPDSEQQATPDNQQNGAQGEGQ
jgi:prepilin-type N-terminal cleavage/methylation domain-containing protein